MTSERGVLASHRDVERVVELQSVEYVGRIEHSLEVWFEDELYRTEDPTLLVIHKERQTLQPLPPISPTKLAERLHTVFNPHREVPEDLQETLIARAISTSEGRSRLAAAMIEPLRRRFDYGALSRSLMPIQQLPPNAADYFSPGIDGMFSQPHDTPTLYTSVTGYDVPPQQPLQSGTSAAIAEVSLSGLARIIGLQGMSSSVVALYLEIGGSLHAGNNGMFPIVMVNDPNSVWVQNPGASLDYYPRLTWAMHRPGVTPQTAVQDASLDRVASTMGLVRNSSESDVSLRNRIQLAMLPYSAMVPTDWGHIVEEYNAPTKIPNESALRRTGWYRLLEDDED